MAQSKRKRRPAAEPQQPEIMPGAARDQLWISLIILGIVLRIGLACVSIGTNDAAAWLRFGTEINQHGLLNTYTIDRDFNHPPIPGYWAAACAALAGSDDLPLHDSIFTVLFKLAPIAGDCLGIYLIYLIWKQRRDRTFGLFAAAMFSLSIDAIAVSGYHCNTDPLLIALCLLALYLLQNRQRPLLAGIALAAAINVKIIPVLLIPVLLLQLRIWKDAGRFIVGLALGVIPFIPPLIAVRGDFLRNAVQYNSVLDKWGLNYFFLLGEHAWAPGNRGESISAAYYAKARYLILALIGLWAILARVKPRWTFYETAIIPFAIFLIFAPGFGVQYTVLVGVLLFAIAPCWAVAYGTLAGAFITSAYFVNWKGTFPFYSHWGAMFPGPVAFLGLLTWLLLIAVSLKIIFSPTRASIAQ